ncbi:hypothetical protein Slu03_21800 [Sediminihabitans luteus]|uniref:aminotransferase-like domain-containing protein n=1 Tax=Sediminihabitans luteus TaxID=1138585 RepID=UPI0012FD6FC9|nr:PLP-dependent aminotransferase family protein [Sediminihabitans luteus]GII99802.1 hypothetical protein Slu03_21800 [Sediminihabitans luteus]
MRAWIDRSSSDPLYVQVRRFVERGLRTGRFPPQRRLPSSRELAQALGVSRNTINAAYLELVALGLLVSRPRSGLYPAGASRRDPDERWPGGGLSGGRAGAARDGAAHGGAAYDGAAHGGADHGGTGHGGSVRPGTGRGDVVRPASAPDWADHVIAVDDPWPERPTIEPDYTDFPYPFLPGQVELRSFPARTWLRASTQAFDGPHRAFSLRDSVARDDPLLVDEICSTILPAKGIAATPDEVLVTNGSQQALSLLAATLLDPGRTVAVENPGYVDAARIFRRAGARLLPCPVDAHGVVIDDVADVDVAYVTPSHHHPTNVTLSPARRERLLAQAVARDFVVVEDDFDSEVRYRGSPTPAIKARDVDGRVVYLGTFSKFLAPGLRLGFLVADAALVRELRDRRYHQTKHPSGHLQRTLGLFVASGDYHRQLMRHRLDLRRKWETLGAALDAHVPWPVGEHPTGGLSYWLTGPEGFDGTVAARLARRHGVLVSPGAAYHLTPDPPRTSLRVGFNAIPQARIVPGVVRLAEAIGEATA